MPQITSLDTYIVPTTVADGKGGFHPGIKYGLQIWYWPNDTFLDQDEAADCAQGMIEQTIQGLNESLGTAYMRSLT